MRIQWLSAVLMAGAVFGQTGDQPIARPPVNYPELKTFLNLTDGQVQSLFDIQNQWNQSQQAIYSQMNDKYALLYTLMNDDGTTAVQLGQVLVDIRALQKKLTGDGPYRTQAAAVLTPDQKNKIPTLVLAVQLQPAVWQAIALLLIEGSNPIAVDAASMRMAPAAVQR